MRPTLPSLSGQKASKSHPRSERRPAAEEKASVTPRPRPKRSLNEAAHKLDR